VSVTPPRRFVGAPVLALAGVVVTVVVVPLQSFLILLATSVYVEHQYETSGILDGGGGPGDTHAFYLAVFGSTILLAVEAAVAFFIVRRARRIPPG